MSIAAVLPLFSQCEYQSGGVAIVTALAAGCVGSLNYSCHVWRGPIITVTSMVLIPPDVMMFITVVVSSCLYAVAQLRPSMPDLKSQASLPSSVFPS